MKLPDGTMKVCRLNNVLHVPKLSYNLLSVPKATKAGKTAKFSESGCRIFLRKNEANCNRDKSRKSLLS